MNSAQKQVKISDTVTWRKVKDEAVILNLETSEYYSVNPVGTLILELLSKNSSLEKISLALAEEYGISRAEAGADSGEFIKKLSGLGLITEK